MILRVCVAETPQADGEIVLKWTGKSRGGVIGNWIMAAIVRYFGLHAAYLMLIPICTYFLFFAPTAVRASQDFRKRVGHGGGGWLAGMWGAFRHFFEFGKTLLDRVALIASNSNQFKFDFIGEEHLREALEKGKGLVLISGHCGNWEIAAHLLSRLRVPVSVVGYENEIAHIKKFFEKLLENRYFSVIEMDRSIEGSLKIMNALARGEIVAMHADRYMSQQNESVQFIGAAVRFPTGPYIVSALSGAPLIHAFAMRERTCRYRFYAYPPEYLAFNGRNGRQELLREWAQLFARRLENIVRKYPLQWNNLYNIWESDEKSSEIMQKAETATGNFGRG